MKKKNVLIVLIFCIILSIFIGILIYNMKIINKVDYANLNNSYNDNINKLKEKTNSELEYISKEIIYMLNKLNNISISSSNLIDSYENKNEGKGEDKDKDENFKYKIEEQGILVNDFDNINWIELKNKIEKLYDFWTITAIDLYSLDVNKDDVLIFSNILNDTIINIEIENKNEALNNLSDMYSYILKYNEQINNDSFKINIERTKSYIIRSYVFVSQNNWNDANIELENAINNYTNFFNNINNNFDKEKDISSLSKLYVDLNEIYNTVKYKNIEIFFIKYKLLINDIIDV